MTFNKKRRAFIKLAGITTAGFAFTNPLTSLGTAIHLQKGKRIGIIGLDTSHSVAFSKELNKTDADAAFNGYKIVAAYPYGSKEIESSVKRMPGFIEDVKKMNVEIVDSIPELLKKVDFVLLETNDGRLHLQQALPVLKARIPMFIDKPMAASLKDTVAIFDAAKKYNTPVFSTSSLRYISGMEDVKNGSLGKIIGAQTYSPSTIEKTHPDFFWYGIHGIETLFTIMGPNWKTVSRVNTPDTDVLTGIWEDGGVGTFRGTRSGKADYGGTVFGEKGNLTLGKYAGYNPLLKEIIRFFDSGIPPVSAEETIAIMAFMEAADESKKAGGKAITVESIFKKNNLIKK